MNILTNSNHPEHGQFDIAEENHADDSCFGEKFATAVLVFYTTTALLVSAWSILVINSGDVESGGPIGIFIQILKTSGII